MGTERGCPLSTRRAERGSVGMRVVIATLAFFLAVSPVLAGGNVTAGQHDFGRCATCHSVEPDHNGIGPSLADIAGRPSGTAPGYEYSRAMASAHITCNDASLDRFLSNTQGLVHGTKMFVGVPDARQRQDIVAYLDIQK